MWFFCPSPSEKGFGGSYDDYVEKAYGKKKKPPKRKQKKKKKYY